VEVWTHRGELFELTSCYLLHDDAWAYEIRQLSGDGVRCLAVLIPDATPIGAFTPQGADRVRVLLEAGTWPWPVLTQFLRFVDACDDIVPDDAERVTVKVFGTWELPWPVLSHFVAAVAASGAILSRPSSP
jgi:hypothetical protein